MKRTYFFSFLAAAFLSTAAYADPIVPQAGNPPATPPAGNLPAPVTAADLAALREELARTRAEVDALRGGRPNPPANPPAPTANPNGESDLERRAREARESREADVSRTRDLETAVSFNLSVTDWVKNNAELLPTDVPEIVKLAMADRYATATARASAVKLAIVESYFKVQANLDTLTAAQKAALDDFRGLTKDAREEKAAQLYANIFEPVLEATRRVRKAEDVGRANAGKTSGTSVQAAYRDRVAKSSRKTYLGEASA